MSSVTTPVLYTGFEPVYMAALERRLDSQSTKNDTLWINSPAGIDDVRQAVEFLRMVPIESSARTVVVDLRGITKPAQQALLRMLETPYPEGSVMLHCPDTRRVLPTVLSRCLILDERPEQSFGGNLQLLMGEGNSALRATEIAEAMDLGLPVGMAPTAADYAVADRTMELLKERDVAGILAIAVGRSCTGTALTALRERLRERRLYRELLRTYQPPTEPQAVLMRLLADVLTKRRK